MTENLKHNNKTIEEKARDRYMQEEFLEKVIKYLKVDNLINEHKKEYKTKITNLTDEKQEMEDFIVKYLETFKQDCVNFDGGKLEKKEKVTTKNLSQKNTMSLIFMELQNIVPNSEIRDKFIQNMNKIIDEKKVITKHVKIVRKNKKEKKSTKVKNSN
jgi:hypothetical protein